MNLPTIDVRFKQLAATSMQRSSKGEVIIICHDSVCYGENQKEAGVMTFKDSNALAKAISKFEAQNYEALQEAFLGGAATVTAVVLSKTMAVSVALDAIESLSGNYLTYLSKEAEKHNEVIQWVKTQNKKRIKPIKYVAYRASLADDKHVINFANEKVSYKGETVRVKEGYLYLGRIAGLLAGLPYTRSATYYKLAELESCSQEDTAWIDKGHFMLINVDGEVLCGRGINSLVTFTKEDTEDMRYIAIVEAMDIQQEDIKKTFINHYVGKFKNTSQSKMLFISSVNSYFRALATEEILDPNYPNKAYIDVEAVREWYGARGTDLSGKTDAEVSEMGTGTFVFMTANVKLLNAIEDLKFSINIQ